VGQYNDVAGPPQHGFLLSHGTYTAVDFPGALRSVAADINERGDIVGEYVDTGGGRHMYLLSNGVFSTIDFPGATATSPLGAGGGGINAIGDIVGSYQGPDGKIRGFFRGASGGFTTIDFPDTMSTAARDINAQGDIVGFYRDLSGRDHGFLLRR
jgi:hypothetical protein